MVFGKEDLEILLTHTLSQRHELQFKHITDDLKIDLNTQQECFANLSIFEKVLSTPESSNFIDLCISSGSSFFKKNENNLYPLHFAISSMCAENVMSLLQAASSMRKLSVQRNVMFLNIVNESFAGGNNYLHDLIRGMTAENFENVSKVVQVLVVYGCSINTPNDQQESPFDCLLEKMKTVSIRSELIEFLVKNARIDFSSSKTADYFRIMQDTSLSYRPERKDSVTSNFEYMIRLLDDRNDQRFIAELNNYRVQTLSKEEFREGLERFLRISTTRNLCTVIEALIAHGANVNYAANGFYPPAFVACMFGHHQALEIFLKESSLRFECKSTKYNLLHKICKTTEIHEPDRQQCFNLVVNDIRCTMQIINGLDGHGKSPLYYACNNGLQKIIKQLLRRGAFIGHPSVLHDIDREVFEEFLDECIKPSSDLRDKNCEIHVDYRFLMPPLQDAPVHTEIDSVHKIAENENLRKLILHPVIASFVHLKWRKINWIAYFNVFVYLCFMLFLGCFIINFFQDPRYQDSLKSVHEQRRQWRLRQKLNQSTKPSFTPDAMASTESQGSAENSSSQADDVTNSDIFKFLGTKKSDLPDYKMNYKLYRREMLREKIKQHFTDNLGAYRLCVMGSAIITLYEIAQCWFSFRKYFFKLSNWLDIVLIYLSFTVLFRNIDLDPRDFKKYQALTILLMSAQTIQMIAKISIFSMSIHMAIFKKVCITFLKTFSLYLILVLAFAMSFYTLSDDYETERVGSRKRRVDDDEEEDQHGFSNVFESIITTVRMMLSDFDTASINTQDLFQGTIFLVFVVLITVVLFNLLNALAVSDTVQIMKDAELVDSKKRISMLHSYEKLFMFCNITFANVFPELQSFVLKPRVSREILIKNRISVSKDSIVTVDQTEQVLIVPPSNGLIQLLLLFNPTQLSAIPFKTFSQKSCSGAYFMGKKNFDKIVNFCKKKRCCQCGSIE